MLKTEIHDHELWKLQLDEIQKLAESIEYKIVDIIVQTKLHPDPTFILGKGKINEIKDLLSHLNIDTVIFWNNLTSKQSLNLIRKLSHEKEVKIMDRYDLTLEIFEKNATDKLSKMQIELARTRKQLPLYKLQANVTYNKDKAGFRSGGEFAFHSKLKTYDKRIAALNKEIDKFKDKKIINIQKRKKISSSQFVCLTGYYNAGKTTLFNSLTGNQKLVSDKPFTTLSSKYSRATRTNGLFFIDTIGFVMDLDPRLIKSFELNLLDMQNADKILYVIDVSEPKDLIFHKAQYGLNLLSQLNIDVFNHVIIIFNKIEMLEEPDPFIEELIRDFPTFFKILPHISVSAVTGHNLDLIVDLLINALN